MAFLDYLFVVITNMMFLAADLLWLSMYIKLANEQFTSKSIGIISD